VDFEQVAPPTRAVPHSVSVLDFGAEPTGSGESGDAFDAAIAAAKAAHRRSSSPPDVPGGPPHRRRRRDDPRRLETVDDHPRHQVTLSSPLPDGSVHTGVGFYGKYADDGGGSHNVHLSNFAIEGDVRERVEPTR